MKILIEEAVSGVTQRDVLPNTAQPLQGEVEAMYFNELLGSIKKFLSEAKYPDTVICNERYACNLLLAECLLESDTAITDNAILEKLDKYIDLLLYYFKYRAINPQVIELLIESFKMGNSI